MRAAASWQAFKEGKALFDGGAVAEAQAGQAGWRGAVRSGKRLLRVSVAVKSATDLDTRCGCPGNQVSGEFCAHAVAVGLAALAGGTSAASRELKVSPAVSPVTAAVPWRILMPPNWRDALPRRQLAMTLEISPGDEISPADERLNDWLGREGVVAKAILHLNLTGIRVVGFLDSIAEHPRLATGKDRLPLTIRSGERLQLADVTLQDDRIRLIPGEKPGHRIEIAGTFWQTSVNSLTRMGEGSIPADLMSDLTGIAMGRTVEIPADRFLHRLDAWQEWVAFPENSWLESLHFVPAPAEFELALDGSLQQVDARLQVKYPNAPAVPLNTVRIALLDWKTGFQPVRADSASRLPAAETTGWKPVGQDRRDGSAELAERACPPAKLAVLAVPPGQDKIEGLPRLVGQQCEIRDLAAENQALNQLAIAGFQPPRDASDRWLLRGESAILDFLTHTLPHLQKQWTVTEGPQFTHLRKQVVLVSPAITIRGTSNDWLSFDLSFQASDGSAVSAAEVRRLLRSGKPSGKSARGKHLVVSDDVADLIDPLLADLDLRQENGCFVTSARSGEVIREIHNNLSKSHTVNNLQCDFRFIQPSTLRADMRPYQQHGTGWLVDRVHRFGGALLADDMGLGKTLQAIAAIECFFAEPATDSGLVLVVATASLLGNWRAEFGRFAPGRRVRILHGPDRDAERERVVAGEVILTSYGTLARDLAWHLQRDYRAVVVDEASLMRNPDTDHARAVAKLRSPRRIALTGTPVENGVRDLWSVFRFIQPGWLGGREAFRERYELPLASGEKASVVMERLKLKIHPFLLRRTKERVAPELPSKLFIDEFCDLSPDQQTVYRELLIEGRKRVEASTDSGNPGAARMQLLTALLRLRQTCCDLALLRNDRLNQLLLPRRSAKLQRLLELLDEAIIGNHRVLVFSQFQKQLLEIERCVVERGWACLRLDGQTRNRQRMVEAFQDPAGPPVFLISLKAGGYGLNLTAADTVIHFDPWWNPAAEMQATDRAHRIGQTRPVTVYRLLTRGTVEEKVVRLQGRKRELATAIDETGTGDAMGWSIGELKSVMAGD